MGNNQGGDYPVTHRHCALKVKDYSGFAVQKARNWRAISGIHHIPHSRFARFACLLLFVGSFFTIKFRLNIFGNDTNNMVQETFLVSYICGFSPTPFNPCIYQRPQGSYYTSLKYDRKGKFSIFPSWFQSPQDISLFEWAHAQEVLIRENIRYYLRG